MLLQKIADDKMTHGLSLQDKKFDHCPACLFLSLDIFDFLLFRASLLWLAGGCFIFGFLHTEQIIARRYAAAKYRLRE